MFNSLQNNKINLKLPFYDFRESSNDFIWKKNKKMKYFFWYLSLFKIIILFYYTSKR